MPAAATQSCAQCGVAPGKYKCAPCHRLGVARTTCSLACTKAHQQAEHTSPSAAAAAAAGPSSSSVETAGAVSTSTPAALPAVPTAPLASTSASSSSNPTPSAPQGGARDHKTLLQDYLFLSDISRRVTSIGAALSSESWAAAALKQSKLVTHAGPAAAQELQLAEKLREEREAAYLAARGGRGGGRGGRGGGYAGRDRMGTDKDGNPQSREQARRELLSKQAHYRRIRLLLLPEGMQLAKENRSVWIRRWVPLILSAA